MIKEQEAKVLQHLVALQELGIECYHLDGTPMIKTVPKGRVTQEMLEEIEFERELNRVRAVNESFLYKMRWLFKKKQLTEGEFIEDNLTKIQQQVLKKM